MEQKVNNPIQKGMLFLKQNISSKAEAFELLARQAKSLDLVKDRKSTRLNYSHNRASRMPSSA